VSPSVVRPEPDPVAIVVSCPSADDEFIAGQFTGAKFEQWLDAYPGRRQRFERRTPDQQAEERQRVARLFALRTSTMPAELLAAVKLADSLQDAAEGITGSYAPMEGRRILQAFDLAIPSEHDIFQGWGGDTFKEVRRECGRLKKHLEEFREAVWNTIRHLVPPSERPYEGPSPTALRAAKGGAA
jgi:hypothetical protein